MRLQRVLGVVSGSRAERALLRNPDRARDAQQVTDQASPGILIADLTVRRAQPPDAHVMSDLARRAYQPYVSRMGRQPAPMSTDYTSLAQQHDDVWVAEWRGHLVGLLVLTPAEDHLLLDNVAVAPEAQGRGVGGQLLQVAEEQARLRGLGKVRLYTNKAMTENLDYYSRRGYRETHRLTQDGYARVFFSKSVTD